MNEDIPPAIPPQSPDVPPPLPGEPGGPRQPPGKGLLTFFGVLLFVVTTGLCYFLPPFFLVGLIGAIVSLFFRGYRFVFVGYIGTFGVLLLGAIIYCFAYPMRID
jgi:hypothetical protein